MTQININNNSHYFYRVLFTFFIALAHSGFISNDSRSLYLGVDYFFVVSGFFIAMAAESKSVSTYEYTLSRIKKLWPHVIFSFILLLFVNGGLNPLELTHSFLFHITEVIPGAYFLNAPGILGEYVYAYNFPIWYLTILILCGGVVHYFIKEHKNLFLATAPFLVAIFYGVIRKECPSFNSGNRFGYFCDAYILRGSAGLMGGGVIFYLIKDVNNYKKRIYYLARIIEAFVLFSIVYMIFFMGNSKKDIIIIIFLYMLVYLGFFYKDDSCNELKSKILKYTNDLMYPVYLNHIVVKNIIYKAGVLRYFDNRNLQIVFYFACTIIFSAITNFILKIILKFYLQIKERMIEEESQK